MASMVRHNTPIKLLISDRIQTSTRLQESQTDGDRQMAQMRRAGMSAMPPLPGG